MSEELRKKAIDLLLKGATLLAEPCPYCKGVRVMKDGLALCINCGKEPDEQKIQDTKIKVEENSESSESLADSLNKKLVQLTKELEAEKNYEKQQQILKSINSLLETIQKLKK